MSFISSINFRRCAPEDPQNRRSASPNQRSTPDGGRRANSPERSRTSSPDVGTGVSGRRSPQRLVQYATTSARRNRLSAASEEALVEFSKVRLQPPFCPSHSHSIGQLGQEEKLIDLWSKVARIEQRMDLSETPTASEVRRRCDQGCGQYFDWPRIQIAASLDGDKDDILTLTTKVVAHFSSHCRDLAAHEALAIRMAFLVRWQ
jgi:hypothetical protein